MGIKLRLRDFIDLARLRFSNKQIANESGLTVQQLKKLRCWKGRNLPLDLVGKLCHFLIKHRIGDWKALPGAILDFEDPDLFSTLARLKKIIMINGVRHDLGCGDFQSYQDSQLLGNLIHRLTIEGMRQVPEINHVPVDTWPLSKGWDFDAISKRALAKYCDLQKDRRDSLHAFVGTIKSNPAIEPVIVDCFKNAVPFKSDDDVAMPGLRLCPFYLCYRADDKKPASAISGTKLSLETAKSKPGFYYEDENGIWQHLPYNLDNDAAVVFYRINEIKNTIDLVMGGFSAEATGYLAEYLRTAEKSAFWPPAYSDINQQIGIFMVGFSRQSNGKLKTQVIPVCREVIEKRVIKIRDTAQPRVAG